MMTKFGLIVLLAMFGLSLCFALPQQEEFSESSEIDLQQPEELNNDVKSNEDQAAVRIPLRQKHLNRKKLRQEQRRDLQELAATRSRSKRKAASKSRRAPSKKKAASKSRRAPSKKKAASKSRRAPSKSRRAPSRSRRAASKSRRAAATRSRTRKAAAVTRSRSRKVNNPNPPNDKRYGYVYRYDYKNAPKLSIRPVAPRRRLRK
jgi:hypothetical protein